MVDISSQLGPESENELALLEAVPVFDRKVKGVEGRVLTESFFWLLFLAQHTEVSC